MLSRLRFGAFLVYGPRATTRAGFQARRFVRPYLKEDRYLPGGRETASRFIARRLREILVEDPQPLGDDIFGTGRILVPVPRSTPLAPGGLWPAQRIAQALVEEGLGGGVMPLLERHSPVASSSQGFTAEDRPDPWIHYESLAVTALAASGSPLVLVDDVVTRGSTLIACASRLAEAYPGASIRAFAVVRTLSGAEDIPDMKQPCVGLIHCRSGRVWREP